MQHNIRLMNIHFHFRISVQNNASHFHIDFHGIQRIIFPRPSRRHFKRFMLVRIDFVQIFYDPFSQFLKAFVFNGNNRTDTGNPEHFLQSLHGILIIKRRDGVHIDSSVRLPHLEIPVCFFQGMANLLHERVFKKIPVFPLYSDFRIFN